MSACGREQAQRRQALASAPARYRRSTASSAARVSLSTRSARLSGLLLDPRDQVGAADDEAGLRAAQQLVAAERDQIGAGGQRLRTVGSCGRPQRPGRQAAAAQVHHQRQAVLVRDRAIAAVSTLAVKPVIA
jgi:hypothetical protein